MLKVIDSGAHGTVFEGRDLNLGRKIAVKLWYRTGETVHEGAVAEARKLAMVSHPLFATVYHFDAVGTTPYSVMEFLPRPSLKKWLKLQGNIKIDDHYLINYLQSNQLQIRQRCKFWYLYSSGLRYVYSLGMVHGNPAAGNVIVVDDNMGASTLFLEHHIFGVPGLASIKILDLGTSLLWADPSRRRAREEKIILETDARLFPDFDPRKIMNIDQRLEPEMLLGVIDKFAEYILELSSIPRLSKDDFTILSHELPQLLGWCPFFKYRAVGDHLESLFHAVDAEQLIRDTRWQMEYRNIDPPDDAQQNRAGKIYPSLTEDIDALTKMSQILRTPQWRFEPYSEF